MRPSKRRELQRKKEMAKIAGVAAGTLVGVTSGIVAAVSCKKKKVYEDSMTDVKTSDDLL